jgi:hypothetical protein
VTAYPAWTPASRPGIVPLHPFGFGTTLGRSFTALRQNPGVLLGFALGVQAIAYLVILVVVGGVAFASFSRLDTLVPGSDDFEAVLAGSFALTLGTSLILGLAAGALTVIVQGVVVSQVAWAVVAEKLRLRDVWRRIRPVVWRLIGYSFLVALVTLVVFAVIGGILFALGTVVLPLAIVLGVIVLLGSIPLSVWLSTKLVLVPAAIILEHARIIPAMRRSWQLTRRRFWHTFGIIFIISATFGVIANVVGIPLQIVAGGLAGIVSPTGDPDVGVIVGFIVTAVVTQLLTLLVQCIALIVQSTATALIYVDSRMRSEGLDLDLMSYVDARDSGASDLPDPYRAHVGRVVAPRLPVGWPAPNGYAAPAPYGYAAPPGYPPEGYPQPGYAQPGYPQQGYPQPAPGAPQPGPGAAPAAAEPPFAAAPPAAPAPPAPAATQESEVREPDTSQESEVREPEAPQPPSPTQWTAPGSDGAPRP